MRNILYINHALAALSVYLTIDAWVKVFQGYKQADVEQRDKGFVSLMVSVIILIVTELMMFVTSDERIPRETIIIICIISTITAIIVDIIGPWMAEKIRNKNKEGAS